jgi:hypothetical protein
VIPFVDGDFEGRFDGEELRGTLAAGGTDWQRIRQDGSLEIRARYMLETDAGERLQVVSEGLRTARPEVLQRLAAGEDVPTDQYYFRTFIRLSTGAPRLRQLNDRIYVGVGERMATRVRITVYAVP